MKYIKLFEEKPAPKKRLSIDRETQVENLFKDAAIHGSSSPNVDYLSDAWEKISSKYHLYDNYYLYLSEDPYVEAILSYNTFPSGNWYSSELSKVKTTPSEFRSKIESKIKKMEESLIKLDSTFL